MKGPVKMNLWKYTILWTKMTITCLSIQSNRCIMRLPKKSGKIAIIPFETLCIFSECIKLAGTRGWSSGRLVLTTWLFSPRVVSLWLFSETAVYETAAVSPLELETNSVFFDCTYIICFLSYCVPFIKSHIY